MAQLDEYWNKIKQSESFQDLDVAQKEKVRSRLWDQYIQKSPSYTGLELTQRNQVRKHFDDLTKIEPESMAGSIMRKGKKAVAEAGKIASDPTGSVEKGVLGAEAGLEKAAGAIGKNKLVQGAVKGFGMMEEVSKQIEPAPMRMAYEGLEKGTKAISKAGETLGEKIEPNYEKPTLTGFDVARAIGAGSVKVVSQALTGLVPTSYPQTALYGLLDVAHKFGGTTFLGRDISMPWTKAKSGLSASADLMGDDFEKLVTQENINQHVRSNLSDMKGGPPKPLEVLANKEQALKAQSEVQEYEEWLKQAEERSDQKAGPGIGQRGQADIYPEAKVNVSQLRDMAQERLKRLQNEPVRVESVGMAEDELQGYYRRRMAAFPRPGEVLEMPERTPLPVRQPGAKTGDPHALFAYNDEFGPGGSKRSIYNVFGDPEHPDVKKVGWGSSIPEEKLKESGIPVVGREPKSAGHEPIVKREPGQGMLEGPKTSGLLEKGSAGEEGTSQPQGGPSPTEQGPQAPQDTSHASEEFHRSVFPGPKEESFNQRLTSKPEYVKMRAMATDIVGRFAKERGVKPTEEFAHDLWREMHDALGAVRKAPMAERAKVAQEIKSKYPNLQKDFEVLTHQTQSDLYEKVNHFEKHIMENYPVEKIPPIPPGQKAKDALKTMYQSLYPDQSKQANEIRSGALLKALGLKPDGALSADHIVMLQKFVEREHADYVKTHAPTKPEALDPLAKEREEAGFPAIKDPTDLKQRPAYDLLSDLNKNLGEKGQLGGDIDPVKQAAKEAIIKELVTRARALGYETSQDIMLFIARNAPKEAQDALRKNLAPTLSAFDTRPYKEMEAAGQGNEVAKKSMMDSAQQSYLQNKMEIAKGTYKRFKANQQAVLFKDMDEGLMRLKNELFIHDNYRKFSVDEDAAQRWFLEKKSPKLESLKNLGVPEDQAKRWLDLAKNPTENMKNALKMTRIFTDEAYDAISSFYDRVAHREDYAMRRWKRSEQYLDWEGRTLGNRPNFSKGRTWLTQADGIDAGHSPASFSMRDDLRAMNNLHVNTLSRIHAYQKLGASFGPDGMPAIIDESETGSMTQAKNAKITPHSGQAPASWFRPPGVPLLNGLAIHPYYKSALNFLMTRPFTGTTPAVLDFLSSSTKATSLMGLFHGYSLSEMLASGISYRDVFSFSKNRNVLFRGLKYAVKAMTADLEGKELSKNPVKAVGEFYRSFMTGSGMLANRPLALTMAERGFNFGAADEDMHNVLKNFINKTEDYLSKRIGEQPVKTITGLARTAVDIENAALFRYLRPISSMLVYETNVADAMEKNLKLPVEKRLATKEIEEAIVNQTSKAMGGISYARLMIDPKTQQILQWIFLAPSWTIGRILMATSLVGTEHTIQGAEEGYEKGGAVGAIVGGAKAFAEGGPATRMARKQMLKLFMGWYVTSNMINYAQTKKYLGEGRFMNKNPEGYKDKAFLSKQEDGSTRYGQMSKALTEIYDDLDHPARTFVNKLGKIPQAAAKIMNWGNERFYYQNPYDKPENPLLTMAKSYEPMLMSGQSAYGGLPVRRGPSKNMVMGMLDEYHKTGNQALFEEAMQVATENGYDFNKLDRSVRGNQRSQMKRDLLK